MKRRRGFAMLYALALLGLVAMALVVLADHFRFEAQRTRNTQADAQLHQLLLAGNDDVAARAATWPAVIDFKSADLMLPTAPVATEATLSIKLVSADAETAKVEVSAKAGSQNVAESLTLKFSDEHWHVIDAALIGEGQ